MKTLKVNNIERIGNNIKKIRKEKGLTIADLSLYTGLSAGYLSNVERNQTSPTLSNLSLIGNTLGIPITELISMGTGKKVVIERENAINKEYPEFNMEINIIDFNINMGVYTYITINPGESESVADFIHPYPEICTVLKGELTIIMNDVRYVLKEGDTIYIKQHIRHTMLNNSDKKCVSFWHRNRPITFE